MQAGELLAGFVELDSAGDLVLLHSLLLHLDRIVGKVAESGVAVQGAIRLGGPGIRTTHKSADLILQSVVFLLQLVVLFFDPEMMLDLLCLVIVANLHLMTSHLLYLFL